MEVFRPFISIVVYFSLLQLIKCSLPTDTEPAEWKMHLEIPVVNHKYILNDVIPDSMLSGLNVVYGDSTNSGDTVSVVKKGVIRNVIEKELGKVDTGNIEEVLGPLTLQRIPDVNETFLISSGISGGYDYGMPLPYDARLYLSKEKNLEGVKWIIVDESSDTIDLTVENRTDIAVLEDISIVLSYQDDTIAIVNTGRIATQTNKVFHMTLAGKRIQFPVTIGVGATIPAGTIITSRDGISIFFSFNQQKVSEALINDVFVDYSEKYYGTVKIADSLHIESIDLDTTMLFIDILCPSLMKIEVKGVLENVWKYEYAVSKDLQSAEQLNNTLDSTQFAGTLDTDTLFKKNEIEHCRINKHIQPIRVFPSWDALANKCFIRYEMSVKSIPENRLMHYCKTDSIRIMMVISQFPFDRISGCFMKETQVQFSNTRKFGFDWKSSITNPLKKMFSFQHAQLDLKLTTDLPFGSKIDSMLVNIVMSDQKKPNDSASLRKTFYSISSDSVHLAKLNFTNVFNNWPDSVTFDTRFILPSKTGVILKNSDERKIDFNEALAITMALDWRISVPLCWEVVETIKTELDISRFSLNEDQIEWLNKLQDPKIRIYLDIGNYTNAEFRLHALAAGDDYREALMSCPESLAGSGDDEYLHEHHLFSLFEKNGLYVKSRGKKTSAVLQLDKEGIDALASKDTCLIRWFLTIPSKKNDALHATDYWTLKAKGIIEGTGNYDSLLGMSD